jgi:DNA-binding NarL/FixJ family response regulator
MPKVERTFGEPIIAEGARHNGPVTVLIIDAHQLLAQALARVLNNDPQLEVVGTQGDPDLAVEAVRRTQPDVVLMSYPMMQLNGGELSTALRTESPNARVIVLTSAEDQQTLLACVQAGAVGYLNKDNPPTELISAIKQVHAGDVLFPSARLVSLLAQLRLKHRTEAPDVTRSLTPRELEVLRHLAMGMSTVEVACRLGIAVHTVRTHQKKLLSKLQARSKLEAVLFGLRAGLIELSDNAPDPSTGDAELPPSRRQLSV